MARRKFGSTNDNGYRGNGSVRSRIGFMTGTSRAASGSATRNAERSRKGYVDELNRQERESGGNRRYFIARQGTRFGGNIAYSVKNSNGGKSWVY